MLNDKDLEYITNLVERSGWWVNAYEHDIELGEYTSMGQDFSISLSTDEINTKDDFMKSLASYIDDYDVSEKTSMWIGSDGHGINGAPYDMIDVYKDQEEALDMTKQLYYDMDKQLKQKGYAKDWYGQNLIELTNQERINLSDGRTVYRDELISKNGNRYSVAIKYSNGLQIGLDVERMQLINWHTIPDEYLGYL